MVSIMTNEEYVEAYGANAYNRLLDSIEEAEADGITADSMDQSSLTYRNITPETMNRMRAAIRPQQR